MKKYIKKALLVFLFLATFLCKTAIQVFAEDTVEPGSWGDSHYYTWRGLAGGSVVDGDSTMTYFSLDINYRTAISPISCHKEEYTPVAGGPPSSWYWHSRACITAPGIVIIGGNPYHLFEDGIRISQDRSFYHGYENLMGTPANYTADYVLRQGVGTGRYLAKYRVLWRPDSGINQLIASEDLQSYDYRRQTSSDSTVHYSPKVNDKIPYPAFNVNANNTGTISGYAGTEYYNLGTVVNTTVPYEVRGGYSNSVLSFVTGSSTTTALRYTATRNASGASNIISGSTYSGIGMGTVAWSVTDWQQDTTNFTQQIIVTTTGAPDIMIYLAGTNTIYNNQWMSQHTSADAERQAGLDVQASSSINGNYDLISYIDGTERQSNAVTKTGSTAVTNTRVNWQNANTTATGIPVTSRAFLVGNRATALSNMSGAKYMRWDNDQPTISSITPTADWTAITGHDATDAISGLEDGSGGVFYKIVNKDETIGTSIPTDSSDEWDNLADYIKPSTSGEYDIWVYAKDNATNRSTAVKVGTFTVGGGSQEPEVANVAIKKTVKDNEGNTNDIFLISMHEGTTKLSTVALKQGNESGAFELDMEGVTSRNIDISEIIPMDYATGFTLSVINNKDDSVTPVSGSTFTIQSGDDITIEVENTFAPTGYFKGKDFVKNLFK